MKELSLNVLDIANNSVKAGASDIEIKIEETEAVMKIVISDNGCGMSKEMLARVTDPFCTTRTTRKVGLGIPFYKLAAEQTGGYVKIESSLKEESENSGTTVEALFCKDHIDCLPLGDIISTFVTLIQGSPQIDFTFIHKFNTGEVYLSTKEMRQILVGVPLNSPEILVWTREYLDEQYKKI